MSEERQGWDRLGEFVAWSLEWQAKEHHEVRRDGGMEEGREEQEYLFLPTDFLTSTPFLIPPTSK